MSRRLDQLGDTIVEVLVVLAVLGAALGIAYATANRGLQQSRNAQEHSEALQLLESQVELLRSAVKSGTPNVFAETNPFCLQAATPIQIKSGPACDVNVSYAYRQAIDYQPDPANDNDSFTLTVSWPGASSLGNQQEQLIYKIHDD